MRIEKNGHPWDIVRNNQLIKIFLESDYDIFCKMDVDQEYPEDYFLELIPLVEKYKVVGPLLFDRWRENDFMPLLFNNYTEKGAMQKLECPETGFGPVPYSHTNLCYAREVLEAVKPPWYEAKASVDGCARANHVDYTFLDKIHKAGYKTYLRLDVVVNHLSMQPIDREMWERWNRLS